MQTHFSVLHYKFSAFKHSLLDMFVEQSMLVHARTIYVVMLIIFIEPGSKSQYIGLIFSIIV